MVNYDEKKYERREDSLRILRRLALNHINATSEAERKSIDTQADAFILSMPNTGCMEKTDFMQGYELLKEEHKATDQRYKPKIVYWCRLDKRIEIASLIGLMENEGESIALYNTPRGHTLSHTAMEQILAGTWPYWEKYKE